MAGYLPVNPPNSQDAAVWGYPAPRFFRRETAQARRESPALKPGVPMGESRKEPNEEHCQKFRPPEPIRPWPGSPATRPPPPLPRAGVFAACPSESASAAITPLRRPAPGIRPDLDRGYGILIFGRPARPVFKERPVSPPLFPRRPPFRRRDRTFVP